MPDELDLLKSLAREFAEPDEGSEARARELLEQCMRGVTDRQATRRPRRRFGVVIATVALLVGSGLGFGIASSLTPSGTASGNVEGLGFIPADGWNVRQTGAIDESGAVRAVATNVPFDAKDASGEFPFATLLGLPPTGAVIVARFSPRGDERRDVSFRLRTLPLRTADAVPADLPSALAQTSLVSLHLRGGVGGYNIAARVFFGGAPSPAMLAAVDEQLRRLVVAPSGITLSVHPRVVSSLSERLSIFGSISSGKSGQLVAIQFKACGVYPIQFRDVFETTTESGGGYSLADLQPVSRGVSGVFRAVSGDSVSVATPVYQRSTVDLTALRRGRFQAGVSAVVPMWRKHVLLQRYVRGRGSWVTLRRLVLEEQLGGGPPPPFQTIVRVTVRTAPFRPGVPRGTRIRAVFPLAQAQPCYLAGISEVRRT